jgi:hypothetical protein
VHVGAATYENISAISNAMPSTPDEKEKKWPPTPCEKVPTPGEKKTWIPTPGEKSSIRTSTAMH